LAHRQQRDALHGPLRRPAGRRYASTHLLYVPDDRRHISPSIPQACSPPLPAPEGIDPESEPMDITQLLAFSVKNKASDLHLSSGLPPMIRVHGDVRRINVDALEHKQVHD